MKIMTRIPSQPLSGIAWSDFAVCVLLVLAVLWRGGKSLEMTWLLVGVACLITLLWYVGRRAPPSDGEPPAREVPPLLCGALVLYILLTLASYITSSTGNYGFDELIRTAALALLFLWGVRRTGMHDREDFLRRFVRILAITTITACVVGVFVYALQPVSRFVGTFFDHRFHTDYWPNAWAEYLLLAWPVVLLWSHPSVQRSPDSKGGRCAFLVRSAVLGFVLGSLLLSFSRGAVVVLAAQLLLWGIVVFRRKTAAIAWQSVIPTAALVATAAAITFLSVNTFRAHTYEVQQIRDKVTFSAAEGTSSISDRAAFWSQALILARRKPLLGWGPYSFRFAQPQFQNSVLSTSDHAHNVFLKVASERGIPAAIALACIIGTVLYASGTGLLRRDANTATSACSFRMLAFLGVFGVLLHNLMDYNLQFVAIAAPFWLLLGVLFGISDLGALRGVPRRIALRAEILLASVLLLVTISEGVFLAISSVGRHAEVRGDRETALRWYRRADGEIFTRDLHLSKTKLLLELGDLEHAQIAIDTYFKRNAEDARAWKLQGDIALQRGDSRRAYEAYILAYDRARYNDLSTLRGVLSALQALEDSGEIDRRRSEFDALLDAFADAIAQNSHWSALSHNTEEFIAIANTLAKLYPKDAPRYQVAAAKVDLHAQIERSRLSSRPPGFLW